MIPQETTHKKQAMCTCVHGADRASGSWPRQDPRGKVSCEGKAGHSYQPNPTENQIVVELRLSTWPWMGRRRKKQTKPLWTQILYLASAPELLVSWATSNQVCESAPGSQGMPPKKNTWEVLQQVEPPRGSLTVQPLKTVTDDTQVLGFPDDTGTIPTACFSCSSPHHEWPSTQSEKQHIYFVFENLHNATFILSIYPLCLTLPDKRGMQRREEGGKEGREK